MIKDIHFTAYQLATYMADKTTVRLVFALSVRFQLKQGILDIKCAFPHEKTHSPETTFVLKPPLFDGSLKHKGQIGRLLLNIHEERAAPFIYYQGLDQHLHRHDYIPREHDPCIYVKSTGSGYIVIDVTLDDFVMHATSDDLLETFDKDLITKYAVKRISPAKKYFEFDHQRGLLWRSPCIPNRCDQITASVDQHT